MTKPDVIRTIAGLRATLAYHAKRYRIDLDPEITDTQYDDMKSKLAALEAKYPEAAQTATVESDRMSTTPVKHLTPRLSLKSTKSLDELKAFVMPLLEDKRHVRLEHKLDGVSLSLQYQLDTELHGFKLIDAVLRGDGMEGDSVLTAALGMDSIPKLLKPTEVSLFTLVNDKPFEVVGEVIVRRKAFKKYNELAEAKGLKTYANPRAAAAGGIRRSKTSKDLELTFLAYDIHFTHEQGVVNHEIPELLHEVGFELGWGTYLSTLFTPDFKLIEEQINIINAERDNLPYDIDGVVLKVMDRDYRREVGVTNTHPNWALAFKYPSKEGFAEIVDVVFQTGRTGRITPVLKVMPTLIDGITVSSITLHNFARFLKLSPAKGDIAVAHRANDVGPQLVKILPKGLHPAFTISAHCQSCNAQLVQVGSSDLQCPNRLNCPAQAVAALTHFVSPIALNIQLFGPQRIEALYKAGKLKTPADFFRLKLQDLTDIGTSHPVATKLLHEIHRKKATTLPRILTGLGIDQVGFLTASAIAKAFHYDLEEIINAKQEAFRAIDKIDEIRAELIERYFATNYEAVMDLLNQGLTWPREQPDTLPVEEQSLRNVSIVITGRFKLDGGHEISRPRVWDHYHRLGAHITENVNANTHFVVAGDNPSPNKFIKAEKLGVTILTQDEFKTRFELPPFPLH